MDNNDHKPHSNVLPTDPDELRAFIDEGFEGEAVEVDLMERFYSHVDELIRDGIEARKKA